MFSSSLLILGLIYDSICPIDGRFAYLNDIYNSHSLAQSRGRWKSRRAVESSHMQSIHLIPTKRFVLSEDNDVTNVHCFSNVIWFCEDALKYSRCSFLGCWFATTDCQFFQVEMTGVRLLQNAWNNFCNVHFMDCVFLNVVERLDGKMRQPLERVTTFDHVM